MIKLMYLMHVDKCWIKQRPHFLAEQLSFFYNMKVLYARANNRSRLKPNSQLDMPASPLLQLPFRHILLFASLNKLLLTIQYLFWILIYRPTHVLVPLPDMHSALFKVLGVKVIYDCMDDALGFSNVEAQNTFRLKSENKLCKDAAYIVASSANLSKKLAVRHLVAEPVVIRNAFNGVLADVKNAPPSKELVLGYFGTVSHWFDFDSIVPVLEKMGAVLRIAGPCEIPIPQSKSLQYVGILAHEQLEDFTNNVSALVMPFKINELILSVDPVKLYEYLNFAKPIICVKYPEVERFADFCEFYNTAEEFELAIMKVSKGVKYTNTQRLAFLADSTWQSRAREYASMLNKG